MYVISVPLMNIVVELIWFHYQANALFGYTAIEGVSMPIDTMQGSLDKLI